eukprot:NODE_1154_length_1994_cov_0.471768.p1 type:complete len:257 gc:universal NODE_1154_length_1994_cov_0.471768:549-1319(+)
MSDCQLLYNFMTSSGLNPSWIYSSTNVCVGVSGITTYSSYYYGIEVTGVDFSYKGMTYFDGPSLLKLTSLANVNLNGNAITTIPSEVCQMKSLMKLNLDSNCITSVPYCSSSYFYHYTISNAQIVLTSNPIQTISSSSQFYSYTTLSYYKKSACGGSTSTGTGTTGTGTGATVSRDSDGNIYLKNIEFTLHSPPYVTTYPYPKSTTPDSIKDDQSWTLWVAVVSFLFTLLSWYLAAKSYNRKKYCGLCKKKSVNVN